MNEVHSGLEGVVAFASEIAEPDRDGGALRYRGVDIEELVGTVPFEQVWGLLVDGTLAPGLPAAEPVELPVRSGDTRVDVQAATAMLATAPLIDSTDEQAREDLARVLGADARLRRPVRARCRPRAGRGHRAARPPPASSPAGAARPTRATPARIDAYWTSAAEHGMNASTFTARVVASTGADVAAALSAAVGALSGPLHGGAPSRVLKMLDAVEREGDASAWVERALDAGERLMGFGHRVYRAEDPRARVLRRTARELGSARYEVAEALEAAALEALRERKPDRVLATNVEFWSAVVLDLAEVPPRAVHAAVRVRAHGRLVGAHPRAEARGAADPAVGGLRRPAAAQRDRGLSREEGGEALHRRLVPLDLERVGASGVGERPASPEHGVERDGIGLDRRVGRSASPRATCSAPSATRTWKRSSPSRSS